MSRAARSGALVALVGIVLLSLGMRSATSSFSPVFRLIDAELELGPVVLGLVGAMPPFAFALAGSLTPALARRVGSERALLVGIALIVVGQVARASAHEAVVIVASTAVTMMGIGVGNVLLPSLVKRFFPRRIGVVTALATTLFAVSGTSPAFFSVPLADAVGWRVALAGWALTVVLAAGPWVALARARRTLTVDGLPEPELAPHPPLARSPITWALAMVMTASAVAGYGGSAWLPLLLTVTAGLDDVAAGVHLGLLLLPGLPAAVLVPLIATRPRPAAVIVAIAGVFGTVGWAGLLVAPTAAPALWSVLAGCGAVTFPLVLVQVSVRAATVRTAVRLSAFVQTMAYVTAGAIVLALGVVHDVTGTWTVPLALVLAVSVLPLFAVAVIARPGRVDDPRP